MSWQLDDEVTTTYGTIVQAHREATEQERERIIEMLEEQYCGLEKCRCQMTIASIIELIQGENK